MDFESIVWIGIFLIICWSIYKGYTLKYRSSPSANSPEKRRPSSSSQVHMRGSNYSILVNFVPERCDKEYEIPSRAYPPSNRVYKTNPFRFQCDCDWIRKDVEVSLESDVPSNDIRRFCRHMVSACRKSRVFSKEVNEKELPLELQTFLNEGFRTEVLRLREVDGRRAILAYNKGDEWINIYLETPKKTKFSKYGFNIHENRWSYSTPPPGLSQTFRQIIKEEIYESD